MTLRSISMILLLTAACGHSSSAPAAKPAAGTAADLGPMCQAYYVRQRSCVDDYLSALIDLRAELDMPKGVAAEVKSVGKPALVEKARVEWTSDTEQPKVDAICDAMATRTPADQVERLLKQGDTCAATPDCKAFAKCAVETERSYIASGAQH